VLRTANDKRVGEARRPLKAKCGLNGHPKLLLPV
jgi:hypothetical protein